MILLKLITYSGRPRAVACDAKCHKAFGINGRPSIEFDSNDPDDSAYLADDEVGIAPIDPGTYEGGEAKPTLPQQRMNKWCVRECERSKMVDMGEAVTIEDFSRRVYNQPWKHTEQAT